MRSGDLYAFLMMAAVRLNSRIKKLPGRQTGRGIPQLIKL